MRKIEVTQYLDSLYIYVYTAADTRFFMKVSLYFSTYRHRVFAKTREFTIFHISILLFFFYFFSNLREKRYQSNLNTKYMNSVPRYSFYYQIHLDVYMKPLK